MLFIFEQCDGCAFVVLVVAFGIVKSVLYCGLEEGNGRVCCC